MKTRFASFSLLASGLLAALAPAAASAEPLLRGLGGVADFGPNELFTNDDQSTGEISITGAFPHGLRFFGMTFTSLYVNNNGNITFGGPLGTFTPQAFPVASQRMIAPWWGDVDTRGDGRPARNGVYWSIRPGQFVATWNLVGYYGTHDDLQNDFQLILTAAGPSDGDFDVEFRYNQCQWTTGDASGGSHGFGGTPAQAGFDAGNLMDFTSLPGSLTMSVLNLCTTSNVGIAGVWRFSIRNGFVDCPGYGTPCTTGAPGICFPGINRCRSATEAVCVATSMPMDDVCNGLDDDCDAATDESLPILMCGVGACQVSQPSCVGGMTRDCVPGTPSAETCNLIDDDCNGSTDDMPELSCGIGICRRVVAACVDGVVQTCTPGIGSMEVCNGFDDDCDGVNDNGLPGCFIDAAVLPDAGHDGGVDAGPRADGATTLDGNLPDGGPYCVGWNCDPFRLQGRAGPGCACGIAGTHGSGRGALVLLAIGVALLTKRRVTRR